MPSLTPTSFFGIWMNASGTTHVTKSVQYLILTLRECACLGMFTLFSIAAWGILAGPDVYTELFEWQISHSIRFRLGKTVGIFLAGY